jgi:hypothetical protein
VTLVVPAKELHVATHSSSSFRSVVLALSCAAALVASSRTASADPVDPVALTPAPVRVERNSTAMMITGIGLTSVGVVALGVGTGLSIMGRQECDSKALDATGRMSANEAGAAAYRLAYDTCLREEAGVVGGTATLVAGGVFTGIGAVLMVAGAWKVTVPGTAGGGATPAVRVGMGSVELGWRF